MIPPPLALPSEGGGGGGGVAREVRALGETWGDLGEQGVKGKGFRVGHGVSEALAGHPEGEVR